MTEEPPLPELRPADAAAVEAMPDVLSAHTYTAHWFSNATFVFPLLGTLGTLIAWAITGADELLGLSIFLAIVTVLMLPLVGLTWAHTATAIVVRDSTIDSLHQGALLKSLPWDDVWAVRKKDTMGNIRWYIVAADEEYISVEGEIAAIDDLLASSRRLAGIPEGQEEVPRRSAAPAEPD